MHSEPARLWRAEYATRIGERRKIVLADGTEVYLNTSSAINTHFNDQQRQIVLETGEILVQTGKDNLQKRPLVITTAYGELRPIGTRFIVKQEATERIFLSVLEGAVEVITRHGQRLVIDVGLQTFFDNNGIAVPTATSVGLDSWIRGILLVREMRLADFVAELGRYRSGVIRCAPEVAELKVSGAFQLSNTDVVIASMSKILPVKVVYLTRYWVTLSASDT